MTPEQKALVRSTWGQLGDRQAAASALFYQRLVEINPKTRRLFRDTDMELQVTRFTQMLSMFINGLDDDPGTLGAVRAAGLRHIDYGVKHSDYDGVGRALLAALGETIGADFTPDVRDAWASAYRLIATSMQQASSSVL
jgi:hemoglobin-like flavoprotein